MRHFWCILLAIAILPGFCQALDIKGVHYLSLQEVAGKLGMKTRWIQQDKTMQLESAWTKISFEVNKRDMTLNGTRIFMGYPIVASRGRFYLSESDYDHNIKPILTPQLSGAPPGLRHIVLDPGHGGKDPGAENKSIGLKEKALTLDLANRVKSKLQARGFRVTVTRGNDTFVSLENRAQNANRLNADLFISLHFNASSTTSVSGVETYAFTPNLQPSTSRSSLHSSDRKTYPGNARDEWNTLAAYYVQRSLFTSLKARDRGLKRARFTVLRDIRMPGILVEGGFVTNNTEGRNIGSASYRDKLATAIVDGILVYKKTLDRLAK